MPKISIIVPVYNPPEKYFEYCCQSLLNQTFADFEVILINNAASGNIPYIIQKYCDTDTRFKSYVFEKNVGFSGACNKGLELATGDYIQIVDSDDYLVSQALSIENDRINTTGADVIVFNNKYYDHRQNVEVENTKLETKLNDIFKLDETNSWLLEISMCAWNKLFRKEFLLKNNLVFDMDISIAAPDVLMSIKAYLLANTISYIPEAIYCYRINLPNNVMANLTKKGVDLYKSVPVFCRKVDNFVLNNNINPTLIPYIIQLNIVMLYNNFKITHKSNKRNFYYLIQKYLKENKALYTNENLQKCNKIHKKFVEKISLMPYWLYKLMNSFYIKAEENGITRIRLFGIVIYKQWPENYFINRRYLGLLKIKSCNVDLMYSEQKYLLEQINTKLDKQKDVAEDMCNKIRNLKTILEAQKIHPNTFGKYKNAFVGKNIALVCTGPTAQYYRPIDNTIHIGVNGAIYLNQIKLDYLFVQDYTINQKGNETLVEDCCRYIGNDCKKFFGIIPDGWKNVNPLIERIPLSFSCEKNISQYVIEDSIGHNIAYDLSREPIGDFCGTVFSALQFILYTNPQKLYLVGWDCSAGYAYNKENAMSSADYQKAILKEYFLPYIKTYFPDLEIISINPVGLKDYFFNIYTEKYSCSE